MMRRFITAFMGVLVLSGFWPIGNSVPVQAQTVAVTARSAEELANDLEYLVKLITNSEDPKIQAGLDMVRRFREGELLQGVDLGRSFGAALILSDNEHDEPVVLAAIPVTDYAQFLDAVKGMGVEVDDTPGVVGFTHKITAPDRSRSLYALEKNEYALFSLFPANAALIRKQDPATWNQPGKGGTRGDLTARIDLAKLPQIVKDQFLNGFKQSIEAQAARRPNENDAEFRGRQVATQLGTAAIESLARDGDTIELSLDIDRASEKINLDLVVAARPDTPMAAALKEFSGRKSAYSSLASNAPLAGWMSFPVPKEMSKAMLDLFDQTKKEQTEKAKTDEEKALIAKVHEIVAKTLAEGNVDLGLALQGPFKNAAGETRYAMAAAVKLGQIKEIEKLLREEILPKLPADHSTKLTLDAAKADDGTPIHKIEARSDDKPDADFTRRFGATVLWVATTGDNLLLVVGEEGLTTMKQAIAGITGPDAAQGEPVAVEARLNTLGEAVSKPEDLAAAREAASVAFADGKAERDHFGTRLKVDGEAVRIQMTFDGPTFKYFSMIGARQRMALPAGN